MTRYRIRPVVLFAHQRHWVVEEKVWLRWESVFTRGDSDPITFDGREAARNALDREIGAKRDDEKHLGEIWVTRDH